jgi:F-type H+-transporting ATPase subunit b
MAQPTDHTHATVAHSAQEHGGGEFPPFNTSTYPAQLIWLAITFAILYYMMAKVIVPRLSGLIETRRQTIANDLDQASGMRARAEEAGAAYEKSLAEARAKAQAIAQETRTALTSETEGRRKALEAELAGKLSAADAAIQARTAAAMSNVQAIAVETAGAIVERLTGRAPNSGALAKAAEQIPQA